MRTMSQMLSGLARWGQRFPGRVQALAGGRLVATVTREDGVTERIIVPVRDRAARVQHIAGTGVTLLIDGQPPLTWATPDPGQARRWAGVLERELQRLEGGRAPGMGMMGVVVLALVLWAGIAVAVSYLRLPAARAAAAVPAAVPPLLAAPPVSVPLAPTNVDLRAGMSAVPSLGADPTSGEQEDCGDVVVPAAQGLVPAALESMP